MPRSSLPQRAIWSKLLPGFSPWLGIVGVLLSGISLTLTGISDLNWGIKIGLCLISLVIPILAYAIWKYTNSILQRVKQYDPLYDGLMSAISDNQQLQENLMAFSQILRAAGVQMFEVTGLQWGNRSPLVVIACDQPVPLGSKLAVISVDTLNALGRFEVIQSTFGGYLAQEDLILDPIWWGYLHQKLDISPHPRFDDSAVAILLVK